LFLVIEIGVPSVMPQPKPRGDEKKKFCFHFLVAVPNLIDQATFFVAGAIVFRLVTTLEAYLRTSGESNHHR